jgi:sugar phosphate isomerase/epimerase
MKLGILQGRLSPPFLNKIQEFPPYWSGEFLLLEECDLVGIEWIMTKNKFRFNPFLHFDLSELPILSVCCDNMIDTNFYDDGFQQKNLIPILDSCIKNKINKVVIPLLEDSSIVNLKIAEKFFRNIKDIAEKYKEIEFCFEFECDVEHILNFIRDIDNFYITYDTGNLTSYYGEKINHDYNIKLLNDKIKNVHIKDRTFNSKSVFFGLGDTNFKEIFDSLKFINYNDNIILQLCRENDSNELNYIKNNVVKIKSFI